MKLTQKNLKQIIREEIKRAVKEGDREDYEESLELQLKRARRDGLEGKEAYEWAKKNLRSVGIYPPLNKPALGRQDLKEVGGLVDDVPIHDVPGDKADDVKNLDTVLNHLLDAHHASAFDRALQGAIDRLIADIQDRMADPMGLE